VTMKLQPCFWTASQPSTTSTNHQNIKKRSWQMYVLYFWQPHHGELFTTSFEEAVPSVTWCKFLAKGENRLSAKPCRRTREVWCEQTAILNLLKLGSITMSCMHRKKGTESPSRLKNGSNPRLQLINPPPS